MEHRAKPALWAWMSSAAEWQLLMRQGATREAMADSVGPHWQATSSAAQPAAEMAETKQEDYTC